MLCRNEILCVCALKLGNIISGKVLSALQGVDFLVTTLPTMDDDNRVLSIKMNRALAQKKALKKQIFYKAVILVDGDVELTAEAVDKLIENYNENECKCILTKERKEKHIFCSCCILSFLNYSRIDYWNSKLCQCSLINDLMPVSYIDGITLTEK